ncbi:hypothetical protein M231_07333 [Tremella mesenterica]|uniref:Uncharacterized protein n=1 Tax=Tremella mesenterica TaxID=5217 RepID=A0A4Q1B9C9_TREME|nr:hypothetical protein M231_07333 [Tremella mesenterica]
MSTTEPIDPQVEVTHTDEIREELYPSQTITHMIEFKDENRPTLTMVLNFDIRTTFNWTTSDVPEKSKINPHHGQIQAFINSDIKVKFEGTNVEENTEPFIFPYQPTSRINLDDILQSVTERKSVSEWAQRIADAHDYSCDHRSEFKIVSEIRVIFPEAYNNMSTPEWLEAKEDGGVWVMICVAGTAVAVVQGLAHSEGIISTQGPREHPVMKAIEVLVSKVKVKESWGSSIIEMEHAYSGYVGGLIKKAMEKYQAATTENFQAAMDSILGWRRPSSLASTSQKTNKG